MDTMDSYTVLNIISIFIYPMLLAVVSVLRFNCFSLCYLLMFFFSPFLPAAKRGQSTTILRICLTIVLVLSSVFIFTQSAYNIAMLSLGKNESSHNCSLGEITNQIGLHQFREMVFYRVLRVFVPDFAVCIFAILTLLLIRRVERSQYHALAGSATAEENLNENTHNSYASFPGGRALPLILQRELIVNSVFNIATIACFVLAAIMSPSVLSAVYLVVCLIFATLWACMKLSKAMPPFRILLIIYVALHTLTYYIYQFPFAQRILPSGSFTARLLGLYWLFQTNCSYPGELIFNYQVRWTEYVTPPVTVMLYYVLTRGTRRTMSPRASQLEERLISDGGIEAPNYSAIRQASPSEAAGGATAPLHPREVDAPTEKPFLVSLLSKIIRVSYIVTFLSMMAWSIIYVSWLSFVMLLTACLIWVVPKSRLVCLHLSPFIVFYGSMMLCLQYIFSMNLKELPTEINGLTLSYFGMKKYEQPVGVLAVQFALMLGFWLTLRLYTTEKMMQDRQARTLELSTVSRGGLLRLDTIVFGTEENRTFRRLTSVVQQQLVKLWIIVTCLLMFFISTQQPVVLFRVVYMVLFLYFMFTFIISYNFWRRQMIVFWWVVIVYSMVVLIGIYTFQFKEVRSVWSDFIQNATLVDMGLQEFESSGLFLRLTTPVIFLVVVIFQVHYFHKDFIRISEMNEQTETTTHQRESADDRRSHGETSVTTEDFVTDVTSVFHTIWSKLVRFWAKRHIIWRLLEVHMDKIVILTAAVCAVQTISALWVPMILVYTLLSPVMRRRTLSLALLYIWVGIIIIAKMSFQLPSFVQLSLHQNVSDCKLSNLTDGQAKEGVISIANDTDWAGLKNAAEYRVDISYPMALLVIIIINMLVHYHQRLWYRRRGRQPPPDGIIFENVNLHDVQKDMIDFLKFLVNHGFFKLGLEITFIVNVIGIVIRLDVYSLIYLVLTGGLIFLPRTVLTRVWSSYCFVLCCLLLLQYLLVLGLPLTLCQPYPWTKYFYDLTYPQWIDFLYLPDYIKKPTTTFLLTDTLRFFFAILQLNVFRLEEMPRVEERGGGTNKPVMEDVMPSRGERDFISVKESFVDYIMHGVLMYFYYGCLAIIFITGLHVNLLSLLYLIASFIFLWMGINLFTYKRWQLLKIWDCLIGFNLVVMFLKCGLQIAGCIYYEYLLKNFHVIPDLFSVKCLNVYQHQLQKNPTQVLSETKPSSPVNTLFYNTLTWDVICFACMLLQRKIFSTRIFANIVLDVRVQKKFASRGAAIINSRLIYEVTKQKLEESRNLARVRRKLERIRLRRQAWGVPTYQEHYKVLRSGDARLFEGDSDNEDESTVNANVDEPEPKDDDGAANTGTEETYVPESQPCEEEIPLATEEKVRMRKKGDRGFTVRLPTPQDEEPHPLRALNLITRAIDTSPRTALEEADMTLYNRPRRKSARSQSETGLAGHAMGVSPSPPACLDPREPLRRRRESDTSERILTSSDEWEAVRPQTNQSGLPTTPEERPEDEIFEDAEEEMDEEEESHRSCWTNFKASCIIGWRIFISVIDSLVAMLNQITKEFRTIRLTLEAERKLAKRKVKEKGELSALEIDPQSVLDDIVPDIRDYNLTEEVAGPSQRDQRVSDQDQWKRDVQALAQQVALAEKEFKKNQSRFFLLLIALSNFASQYWEQLCYFVMVVNHLTSGTLLSMVYPFLIFLWGMLSVPRPSKLFWTVTITYTMIVVVIKYFFQFPTVRQSVGFEDSDNTYDTTPLTMEKLFGLKQGSMFAGLDLFQLMVIFIHRTFLKSNGLWRAVSETREDLLQLAKKYGASLGYEDGEQTSDVTSNQNAANAVVGRMSRGTTITSDMVRHYELSGEHAYQSPLLNIKRFFQKMTDPLFNMRVDVYRWIFFVEFLSLIMLVLTYKSFVPYSASSDSVANYIQNSKVPMPFIAMCFMQFILILIDRSLFLQKLVFGKLIFQFVLMIGIHIWMFFVLPFITNREFNTNTAAQIFYFLKCVYFGLSAYQIRSGYPLRVLGNFLTKKYNYVNLFLYKGFLLVPFLMDLRCIMDWIWTETTLGLYHWNQMEHIYSIVYVVKCWHYSEDQWPTPRGQRRSKFAKYGIGGLLVLFILACIWLPMFIFYIMTATAAASLPQFCDLTLSIGGFTPIFSVSVQNNRISNIEKSQFGCLREQAISLKNDKAYAVFQQYQAADIASMQFDGNSTVIWSITPPGLSSLTRQLRSINSTEISTEFSIKCKRMQEHKRSDRRRGEGEATVSKVFYNKLNESTRIALAHLIQSTKKFKPVTLTQVYPSFIQISPDGIQGVSQINIPQNYVNISVSKNQENDLKWWRISELEPSDNTVKSLLSCLDYKGGGDPTIVTINERSVQENFFTQYLNSTGLIGVYFLLVTVLAKTLRRVFYASDTLRFDDMPQVDRLLRLLDDIYLVREHKDWQLEEELYSKLDFLWRSPETLIQYSKPKQD